MGAVKSWLQIVFLGERNHKVFAQQLIHDHEDGDCAIFVIQHLSVLSGGLFEITICSAEIAVKVSVFLHQSAVTGVL